MMLREGLVEGQAMVNLMRLGRVLWPGGRRWAPIVVAVLAACGVSGSFSSAALAGSSSVPDWTKLAPAIHPSARQLASMAYDTANGTAVLFGGDSGDSVLDGTWTWNGTTWAKQHPATSPPARWQASMAYDAANGTVVLFGGSLNSSRNVFRDTWTWDGTTWTQQAPPTSPPAREWASMAYDAANGTVVLFGGVSRYSVHYDTWTWG
jgi:hypothetical protein